MELGEYDHGGVEAAARELWESHDIYRYQREGAGHRVQALLDQIAEPLRIAARADALIRGLAEHPSGVDGITVGIAV